MGKVANIARARKRKDKKYNPYKMNPLEKKLNKALMGHELDSAIETNEKGEIKLDSAGKPVFKDTIEWETDSSQIMALWTCTKALLEERVVPPNEIDAAFDLLEIYAKAHRPTTSKPFKFSLPINYFVGTWHILNSCRMFHIFKDDKRMDEAVDGLTLWFAQRIDMYHEVKRKETVEEEVSPKEILSLPRIGSTKEYYPEDSEKTAKVLGIRPDHNES